MGRAITFPQLQNKFLFWAFWIGKINVLGLMSPWLTWQISWLERYYFKFLGLRIQPYSHVLRLQFLQSQPQNSSLTPARSGVLGLHIWNISGGNAQTSLLLLTKELEWLIVPTARNFALIIWSCTLKIICCDIMLCKFYALCCWLILLQWSSLQAFILVSHEWRCYWITESVFADSQF